MAASGTTSAAEPELTSERVAGGMLAMIPILYVVGARAARQAALPSEAAAVIEANPT